MTAATDDAGFGVPQIDRLVAPVPSGSRILLTNDPGVEAEPFLYQATASHLAAGRDVMYLVTNRSPSSVRRGMAAFGFEVDDQPGRLRFIDGFSALMGASEDASYEVDDPSDLRAFEQTLRAAAADHGDAVLMVDALSTLADQAHDEGFLDRMSAVVDTMTAFRLTVAMFTRWPYPADVLTALDGFEGRIAVQGVEGRVLFSQLFRAERAEWRDDLDDKPRLFKVVKPGGVFVYVPKILVTGPYNAGKSTFIHTLSDTAVSVDRLGTTVALDHGHVTLDGLTADIFGTPGQVRFDPILQTLATQALGVIVVVDATKPDSFTRAEEMMQRTWRVGLPAIIAANKQDLPDALTPAEVSDRMKIPSGVPIVGCRGADRDSSRLVLRDLLDAILKNGVGP